MEKTILCAKIFDLFAVKAEYPWQKHPSFAVFRHQENKKWFCIYMEITADKLGLIGQETVSIINLKAEPMLIGALRQFDGILPAYHMNKEHWISVILDKVDDGQIMALIEDSFYLTQ